MCLGSEFEKDEGLDLVPIDVGLQAHLQPDEIVDPYIFGGATYVWVDSDRIDVDSDFGAYLGGGLDFALTDYLNPFVEVGYRWVELDQEFGLFKGDIDVGGLITNFGMKLHF